MNIQWPENPVRDKNNNKQPLLMEGRIKSNQISNITMEAYAQGKQSMHKNASVIGTSVPTDYSFIFLIVKPKK
ncbi:hypothetical protein [Chryseobacterium flavum]|uniref:hypothetical protein n=1 Tax=Chryseobacterium flavum TaxID=415851 RepID=UPI0028AC4709|nr:hypothetical protein [Chryseobacterium flavum]